RSDTVLQDLLKKRGDFNSQASDALAQYGPNFPKVQRLQGQLKEIEQLIFDEKKSIIDQMGNDYNAARQRETLLTQALDQQKIEANQMSERLVEYNILKREAEANKTLYDGMLTKLKEANISQALKSSNIRVVDPAMIPSTPTRPAKTRNIALSFIVGLVGGIGLALLREYLDNTVKNPDDIENLARLPSLAVVPAFASPNGSSSGGRLPKLLKGQSGAREGRVELVSHLQPQSQISEAFRALRTSLLLSQADRPP